MRRMIEELSESLWNANEELSMLQHESAALGANARQPTAPQSPEERQHKTKRDLNLDPCEECEQPKAITADRLLELLEARVFPGSHIDIWHEGEHSWTIIGGDKRLVFTGSSLFEALRKAVGGDAA
jgi:hypothetical protein